MALFTFIFRTVKKVVDAKSLKFKRVLNNSCINGSIIARSLIHIRCSEESMFQNKTKQKKTKMN